MEELLTKSLPLITAFGDISGRKEPAESSAPYETRIKVNRCVFCCKEHKNCILHVGDAIIYFNEFGTCSVVPVIVNVLQLKAFIRTQCTVCNEMQNHS